MNIDKLIIEAKKKGKKVNPWAVCTSSLSKEFGTSERSEWSKPQKEKYESCVQDVKKKQKINEVGGYDDPRMFNRHAGGYLEDVKSTYNNLVISLQTLGKISQEVLDDKLRKSINDFLDSIENPTDKLQKSIIDFEKKNINKLRDTGLRHRDLDNEQ
jgi:hypothetical protein